METHLDCTFLKEGVDMALPADINTKQCKITFIK